VTVPPGTETPAVRPYGTDALLVDLPDLAAVRAVDAALRAAPPAGVVDVVPAARTVLVTFGSAAARAAGERVVRAAIADPAHTAQAPTDPARAAQAPTDPAPAAPAPGAPAPDRRPDPDPDPVLLPVLTGLSVPEVVRRHLAGRYTVAFGGFMPGFAYLTGLDPVLHVPRRDTPRERVPAGSVAIAGDLAAVYPAATPGGWRLLGTCDTPLFDVDRTPPALLTPGTPVRFVPAEDVR
jgi:allophanate hydrolase subunit 1